MIQHFSFRNYGSSMGTPCLRGTMAAWVDGSVRDRQSLAFLSPSRSMMCRCVCKLDRDQNSDFGWVAEVLFIRETDYDEAYFMNRVTRGSLSS
ncbi:hypothetical protein QBC46DRAFT_388819 [Diplogelasinospora grovesii]|uniref:Uncharacterized protein n=1 Tax=Diplogelasinospora grovesii TaxID=303347 RepID=A0AAN6S3H6_9PEZI|nr:hypothetical protein QBC46DRAFT_388819 [Diplogelasinospora grovesii]